MKGAFKMSFEIVNPNYSRETLEEIATAVISRDDLIELEKKSSLSELEKSE